jgi:hypothetical protein
MKAFISSTSKDLGDYRQAAFEVCTRLSIVPIGMEQFESMGAGATAGSRHKLDEADVYVGIIAHRYGFIEDGFERSVTELEFDHAGARGLDRLCFVAEEKAGLPHYPEDGDKLAAFKARVDKLVRNTFSTPWEFKYKLYDSLLKWLFRQRGAGPLARHVFEPLFADYSRFSGREEVIREIEAFIGDPQPGILVLTAPAGYGKTALAVRLVELHREVTAYHFFTTLYGADPASEFLSEAFFLRNVVEQVRLWTPFPYDTWETPSTLSGWVAAYHRLLGMPLQEKRVLVIDGLDEVKGWSLKPYLSVAPPANLKIVLTVRDVGQAWAEEYGIPGACMQHLPLEGLSRADVAALLRATGPAATAFAASDALLDKVLDVTAQPGAVSGADPLYVTALADDIEVGRVSAASIGEQPRKLDEYLERWWQALVAKANGESAALDLLGTMAAALGPIGRVDLVALHPALTRTWTADPLSAALAALRRTVAGNEEQGYAFAHPRYRDYVRRFPEVKAYEAKLLDYCRAATTHRGRYALSYAIQHLAAAGEHDALIAMVLDPGFQAAQQQGLGSSTATLADLARAAAIACETDRFADLLRCVAAYRRLAQATGIARAVFADLARGHFRAAGERAAQYGPGVKQRSAWNAVLHAYLVWEAARVGRKDEAAALIETFHGRLGLRQQGALLHTGRLCDALIAAALVREPTLASAVGLDPDWVSAHVPTGVPVNAPVSRFGELEARIQSLEMMLGENPSLIEFIDEERAGEYTARLQDELVESSHEPGTRELIDRALAVVTANPYPRYRDNALVALGVAALAVPDAAWAASRLQSILETGLEKEGVTFTFDLGSQLVAEARRRGMPPGALEPYLDMACNAHDRWGTRMRSLSARAAAEHAQERHADACTTLEEAGNLQLGFAGYLSAHLLALASRWFEFGAGQRALDLDLLGKSRFHAQRVRDPRFSEERRDLIDRFEAWTKAPTPAWESVAATLRETPEPDARRAYKDLVSACWAAEGRWEDWKHLMGAALNDATALDFVLGRLAARAIRRHREAVQALPDPQLAQALRICSEELATSRPWELGGPAYG